MSGPLDITRDYSFQELQPPVLSDTDIVLSDEFVTLLQNEKNSEYNSGSVQNGKKSDTLRVADETTPEDNRASQEYDAIIEEARRKAELIEREAYEKGYKQGEVAGEKMAKKKFESAIRSLEAVITGFEEEKVGILASLEPEIVKLAISIAEKIINTEVQMNPELVLNNIRACLEHIVHKDRVTVRLNPSDFKNAVFFQAQLAEEWGGSNQLIFETDPAVGRGGAVLETDFGELDARIDQQLIQIENELKKVMEERKAD